VVIAADGIRSAVRAQLHPQEGPPIPNGAILWRGVTRTTPFLSGRSMIMAGYRARKFVAYPISPVGDDGLQDINWIAEIVDEDRVSDESDWNKRVPVSVFFDFFAHWNLGWLDVPALIQGAKYVLEYPLVDRNPLATWVYGRLVLLGDAAHPTYPVGSNGSSQAIIDARVLAYGLSSMDIDAALAFYQAERLPKTRALQLANRLMGPEIVMQLAHERAPDGFANIEDVIPKAELAQIAAQYKTLAGFDPSTLNARPAWSTQAPR
jgi:2-polyprenyl-6-methoxyphenol hydroxylase-like FAD-dependent oxidoreductase